jgi:type II secretory pathway pseudopilin PulG
MMHAAIAVQNPGEVAAAQARGAAEAARSQAQASREQAQAQREQAQAQREQAQAARDAARAGQEGTPVVITITKDGKTVTIDNASPEAAATALGIPLPSQQQELDPGPYIVGGIAIVSGALVAILGFRYLFKWKMQGAAPSALPNDVAQRLARMEAGIESVAVEVERISEGQRFTTRLLSDRAPVEVPRG